jgi:Tol biopolymer transport system component
VATGTYRQVIAVPNMVPAWSGRALSPDGRTLAFWSSAGAGKVRLNTVGVDGSSFREVDRFDDRNLGKYLSWSPDGQAILVALKTADKWRIQRIPVQGGQPEFTGIETAAAIQAFSLNTDGSRIVYSSVNTQKDEVWAVDNILKTVK